MTQELAAGIVQFKKTVICDPIKGRTLIRSDYAEGCHIYHSFGVVNSDWGDLSVNHHLTFLCDGSNGWAAEWEPQYGPIQLWAKCSKDWKGENCFGHEISAKPHWHFDWVEDDGMRWSQNAVADERLKERLRDGDIHGIFEVLARWTEGRAASNE